MVDWFQSFSSTYGDRASVIGLCLSFVGFVITIWGVWRSKSAAERAEEAASHVRDGLMHLDMVAECASAMTIMEEIKRLQREDAWRVIPDRYSILRQKLIRIKTSSGGLTADDKHKLTEVLSELADIEHRVEKAIRRNTIPANPDKLSQVVSTQMDQIVAILAALQTQLR
jgi:hypothetical protein